MPGHRIRFTPQACIHLATDTGSPPCPRRSRAFIAVQFPQQIVSRNAPHFLHRWGSPSGGTAIVREQMVRATHLFAVGTICLALSVVTEAQSRPAPDALARSLQQRYQGIKDFSADFVHSYRGGVLKTQSQERGTVSVKKPSRMRWTYTTPEKKEFVSDGVKIYSYIPQDKQ